MKSKETINVIILAIIVVMIAGIFVLDLFTPRGIPDWGLYLVPLFIMSLITQQRYTFLLTTVCTVLLITGFIYSPPGIKLEIALISRLLGVCLLWFIVVLLVRRKLSEEEVRLLNTITEAVHKSSNLREVFNIALDKVMELTDIDIVGIYLVDEATNEAVLEAHRGYPDKYIERAGRIKYPKGVTWKVINSGETYIVQDVSTDPYVGSVGKEAGFQSFMSVPIKIEDKTIGTVNFHSNKRNKFGKREIELFSSIGTQIAIAVAKTKQTEDLQLVNEDLSVLNTIATSIHRSLDLNEVYKIALDAIIGITAFDIIMIYLVDENTNEAVLQAHRGLTEDYIKRAERIPYPKGVTWKVIKSGELTHIDDIQKDPDLGPAGRALGHHTHVSVPIKHEDKIIGVVNFASLRVLELSSRDINLLSAIGSQIGTAIVQAYLYEKSQEQREELGTLYEDLDKKNRDLEILSTITQAVHQSLDLEEIYKIALDMVTGMENVDMAMIYLVDDDRKEAVLQTQRNFPEDYIRRAGRIPYPKGITWKVINIGEIVNIEDVQKDPDIGPAGRDLGHHSLLGVPITLDGVVIGVTWFLSYKERQFNEQEVKLLSSIGNQIALAIAKAKLYRNLKEANEQLKKLDNMKDEFLSVASHELRTPMSAIKGYVSMLLEGDFGELSSKAIGALTYVNTAVERLISLVNDMLDASRIAERRLIVKISEFDLGGICQEVADNMMSMVKDREVKFTYRKSADEERLLVSADIDKVRQVLFNLVGNALKFTQKGEVNIAHRFDVNLIITDVIDTGPGISPEDRGLLFQRFQQLNKNLSGNRLGGTGLGLYISRELVRAMGGDLWLERSEKGQGTTFSFSLLRTKAMES